MSGQLTYLAAPYSHPDPAVRCARFNAINNAAGALMRTGHLVFSPISMGHPINEACGFTGAWKFWEALDRAYLNASRELIVLKLPGWETSVGVTAEIAIAKELGIPVSYLDPPASEVAA